MTAPGSLARGVTASFAVRAAAMAVALLFHWSIARLAGAAVLGRYSLALILALVVAMLARAGTDRALVRLIAGGEEEGRATGAVLGRILSIVVPLSVLFGLALFAAAPWLAARFFHDAAIETQIRILALAVPAFNLVYAYANAFQGLHRIATWALVRELLPNLLALGSLLLAVRWAGDDGLAVSPAISRALAFAVTAVVAATLWRLVCGPLRLDSALLPARAVLRISAPMLATMSLYWILGWGDLVLLGALTDATEAGIYRAARSLTAAVAFVLPAIQGAVMPRLAEAWGRDRPEQLIRIARQAARAGFGSTALAALPVMLLAGPLLRWFGEPFVAGSASVVLLCLGQLAIAACGPTGYLLDMIGEERYLRTAVLLATLVNLGLNLVWIPRWGMTGAAAASLCGSVVWSGLAAMRARRRLGTWIGIR